MPKGQRKADAFQAMVEAQDTGQVAPTLFLVLLGAMAVGCMTKSSLNHGLGQRRADPTGAGRALQDGVGEDPTGATGGASLRKIS